MNSTLIAKANSPIERKLFYALNTETSARFTDHAGVAGCVDFAPVCVRSETRALATVVRVVQIGTDDLY